MRTKGSNNSLDDKGLECLVEKYVIYCEVLKEFIGVAGLLIKETILVKIC